MQIKQWREKAHLTQAQLARQVGITQAYLSELEGGRKKNPSLPVLLRLAAELKAPLEKIISQRIM